MVDEDKKGKWYLNPIVVLLLLFFVLGPLGLPLLYKSPHFGKTWKKILTIIIVVYTAYIIYETVVIVQIMLKWIWQMQELTG
jgi:hypothetical protein